MTVKELIEKLKKENQDLHVYIPRPDDTFPEYKLAHKIEDRKLQNLDNDSIDYLCLIIE